MILFLELLGVAALILLNGYFVAAEYGLVTARRTRIQELAQKGDRRARAVLRIVADPPRFIAAMQLGVTATSLAIGALGEQVLAQVFDPIFASFLAFALAFLIITFLHVVDRRAGSEGGRARVLGANGARRVDAGARVLRRLQAADLGAAALERGDPAGARASSRRAARSTSTRRPS